MVVERASRAINAIVALATLGAGGAVSAQRPARPDRQPEAQRDSVRDSVRDGVRDSARALPAMTVEARRDARRLDRRVELAKSLGGIMVAPAAIAKAAPTSRTLGDLLRRTASAHVTVVSGYGGASCLLVQRMANLQQEQRCALLVVDEVASAGDAFMAPTDVEFLVIVPASAATVRFGERGRYGAVVVYTRAGRR